jgi:hypothetical protein
MFVAVREAFRTKSAGIVLERALTQRSNAVASYLTPDGKVLEFARRDWPQVESKGYVRLPDNFCEACLGSGKSSDNTECWNCGGHGEVEA